MKPSLFFYVSCIFEGSQDYYYQPEDGYMFPKPYKGQSLISYLDSRSYDTGAELDKVMFVCSFNAVLVCMLLDNLYLPLFST